MRGRGRNAVALGAAIVAFALLLIAPATSASAIICDTGTAAGQCVRPKNIAVDSVAGRLYVADSANHRINVFNALNGAFLEAFGWGVKNGSEELQVCTTSCRAGIGGSASGQFSIPWGVAVDPVSGALYVSEAGNRRVQKFDPAAALPERFLLMFGGGVDKTVPGDVCTAASGHVCGAGSDGAGEAEFSAPPNLGFYVGIGPGGIVYVLDTVPSGPEKEVRLQKFQPSGAVIAPQHILAKGSGEAQGLAVNSATGDFWTVGLGGLRRYDENATLPPLVEKAGGARYSVTLDAAGKVFVGEDAGRGARVTEVDSAGNPLRRFGYGSFAGAPLSLAVLAGTGGVYASDGATSSLVEGRVLDIDFPDPGPVVFPEPCSASPLGNSKATLNAEVNPEGKTTKYHFELVTEESFGEDGFDNATRVPGLASEDPSLPADFELHKASFEASVVPETKYRCRVVAENIDGETLGEEGQFESLDPLEIGPTWHSGVGTEAATLYTEVNPLGIPATGYFEYVDDATYQKDIAELGPGHGFDHAVKTPDQGKGQDPIDFGDEESFQIGAAAITGLAPGTTYRYRIVATDSLIDPKVVLGETETLRTFRSGEGGLPDGRAYELVSPSQKGSAEVAVPGPGGGLYREENIIRTQAAAGSGDAITYTSWTSFGDPAGAPSSSQYLSKRGSNGWETTNVSPFGFLFNALEPPYRGFSPDLGTAGFVVDEPPLTADAQEGFTNLYLRDNKTGALRALTIQSPTFIPDKSSTVFNHPCTAYAGASADGSRAFFAANWAMAGAPSGIGFSLYEWSAGGGLNLVSVLPSNAPAQPATATSFGARGANCTMAQRTVAHAVSDDGSTAFWTYGGKYLGAENPLMARIDGGETVQLDAKAGGKGPAGRGDFRAATPNGSRAFFTAEGELTSSSKAKGHLYRYDLNERALIDLTPGTIEPDVQGVIGASEDGTYVYFVASGALTGEEENGSGGKAKEGSFNLYAWHEGEGLRFIAGLSPLDEDTWSTAPQSLTASLTPDGRHLAFLTVETEALSDYDNTIFPGTACQPFVSNELIGDPHCAEAYLYDADTNGLTCVSCNPTGARPTGPAELPSWSNPFAGPRYLAADGSRFFFESRDILSGADGSKRRDVYAFERAGKGTCTSGGPTFNPISGGCLFLISDGRGEDETYLLDASSSGRDVFFSTRQPLVGWDDNKNYDVYDAREGGGFSGPPIELPPCQGEACKAPPGAPPGYSPPATPTFVGPGNKVEKPKKHKAKKHKSKKGKGKKGKNRKGEGGKGKRASGNGARAER